MRAPNRMGVAAVAMLVWLAAPVAPTAVQNPQPPRTGGQSRWKQLG